MNASARIADTLLPAAVDALIEDGLRFRFFIAIIKAEDEGDPTATRAMEAVEPVDDMSPGTREEAIAMFRERIDTLRTLWQPLDWS